MSIKRITVILLHTWYHFCQSMETWVDLFWNSALQMLVFVFISLVFAGSDNQGASRAIIMGAICWNIIWVGQYSVCVGALWEIWSRSFSSLFITPLSLNEFLLGQMISGMIKSLAAFFMAAGIAWSFYHFSIFDLGWLLPLCYLILLTFSWGLGMFILSMIFRWGTQVQSLSWAIIFLVQPLGGVFYPIDILPTFMRWVGYAMPSSYIFDSMRQYLRDGSVAWQSVGIGALLAVIYLLVGYTVLHISYRRALASGAFARMEG